MSEYGAWGPKSKGDPTKEGVTRSTFVIGGEGVVERVYPQVQATGHAQKVLEDLRL